MPSPISSPAVPALKRELGNRSSNVLGDALLYFQAGKVRANDGFVEDQAPPGDVYLGWNGPTVGTNAQGKVRFRLYAVTKALVDPKESPLEIVVRLDKENVGKSEFVVPYAPKTTS